MTSRTELAKLILDVRYGRKSLTETETTRNLVYNSTTALALIRAAQKTETSYLEINGTIEGSLHINDTIESGLHINATIEGSLHINDTIESGLHINATIEGSLSIVGTIKGNLFIFGMIESSFHILGMIEGHLHINDTIKGHLHIFGTIKGHLHIFGTIEGSLSIVGTIKGNLFIIGMIESGCYLDGVFNGVCLFRSESRLKILSLGVFDKPVDFNDSVDLSACDFRGFPSFDKCEFSGTKLFTRENKPKMSFRNLFSHEREQRQKIQTQFEDFSLSTQVSIYRQLRKVYEASGNRPGASDFYFREMEARHELSKEKQKWSLECGTLSIYKHLSSFGLNPYRAFAWFLIVCFLGTFMLGLKGVTIANTSSQLETEPNPLTGDYYLGLYEVCELVLFTFKSMVSFFSPPEADLSAPEKGIQIFLRFTGPILLAQTILATREKVAR